MEFISGFLNGKIIKINNLFSLYIFKLTYFNFLEMSKLKDF